MSKLPPMAHSVDLVAELRPETELEHLLLAQPAVQKGMMWGVPRYGHPEGEVYKHVKDVLANIDRLHITAREREYLRLVAIIHDAFKYKEDKSSPRNWKEHHAVLARNFMRNYSEDELLLTLIQFHDEAYYIWRDTAVYQQTERAEKRLVHLLKRLNGHNQLFYLFFKCDSETGDKNPAPITWVETHFPGVTPVVL